MDFQKIRIEIQHYSSLRIFGALFQNSVGSHAENSTEARTDAGAVIQTNREQQKAPHNALNIKQLYIAQHTKEIATQSLYCFYAFTGQYL